MRSRPLIRTSRTNSLLAFVDHVRQIDPVRLGGRFGAPFEGGVGEAAWLNTAARIVSRSTATLYSLNGWPSTELSCASSFALSNLTMPSTSRLWMKYWGPSSMRMKTASWPRLAAIAVHQLVRYRSRRGIRWIGRELAMDSSSRRSRSPL